MEKSRDHIYTIRKPVVMVWPELTPDRMKFDELRAYFLLPEGHPDRDPVLACALRVLKTQFKTDMLEGYKHPFQTQVNFAKSYSFLDGGALLWKTKAGIDYPPRLSSRLAGKTTDYHGVTEREEVQDELFYSGVQVLASVAFRAWQPTRGDGCANGGVTCYMNHILSTGRGERLGGGGTDRTFSYDWEGELEEIDQFAPTSSMGRNHRDLDDEIPF